MRLLLPVLSVLVVSCATASDDLTLTTHDAKVDGKVDATGDLGAAEGGGDTSGSKDTGAPDTSTPDTGSPDTGSPDSGSPDTGDPDTGTPDTGTPDTGTVTDTGPDTGVTSVTFPSSGSTTYATYAGTTTTLGTGGGGVHYQAGDYCEEAFPRATSISKLTLSFTMSDLTSGCAVGATHSFAVKVNGTSVGTYSFVTPALSAGTQTISKSYTFSSIAPLSGKVTLRLEATTTVCGGGSSWNWNPGGTTTMN